MKKSDLRNGDIVKTRVGEKYILLLDDEWGYTLYDLTTGYYLLLDDYDDFLNFRGVDDPRTNDIMAVSQPNYFGDNLINHINKDTDKWTWERPKVKYYLRLREKYRDVFGIPYHKAYFNIEKPTGELFFEECSSMEGFIVKFTEEEADKYIKEFNNILEKVEIE